MHAIDTHAPNTLTACGRLRSHEVQAIEPDRLLGQEKMDPGSTCKTCLQLCQWQEEAKTGPGRPIDHNSL